MPETLAQLEKHLRDLDQRQQQLSQEIREVKQEVHALGTTSNKILEVMQGDKQWQRKGIIDQLSEITVFMELMKSFNFAEMKDFASEYRDFKKRVLTLAGFIGGVGGILWLIVLNIDKILKAFGK